MSASRSYYSTDTPDRRAADGSIPICISRQAAVKSFDMHPTISRIGWASWSAAGAYVPLEATDDPTVVEDAVARIVLVREDSGVKFTDPKVMVAAAAEHVLAGERPVLTSAPKPCFERLAGISSKNVNIDDSLSGRVLAMLHNERCFDGFAWAREAVEAGVPIFRVLHVMKAAVPYFEYAHAPTIFRFLAESYEREKNDVFGGVLYPVLERWLPRHPGIARELMQLHEVRPEARGWGLYGVAVQALVLHDFDSGYELALTAARSSERLLASSAVNVLGLIDYAQSGRERALERTITVLSEIVANPTNPLLHNALTTASRLLPLSEPVFSGLIEQAARTHDAEALYALAGFVFVERTDYWDRPWFWPLFMHLAHAQAAHRGTLENVDHVLYSWLTNSARVSKVIELLNAWIGNQSTQALQNPGLVTVLDSTVYRLAEVPTALSALITGWLLHPDDRYPMVAHSVVSKLRIAGGTAFALDGPMLDRLSVQELVFLVRRILGYLFGHDIVLPLMFSLLTTREAKERTFGLFAGVVRDRLGYDYPEETLAYLKEKEQAATDPLIKKLCSTLVSEIEARHAAERAVPLLKEFYPSPEKVRRFSKERHRQMAEALETANEQSILRQLMTEIPLKAGRRTFSKFGDRYSDVSSLKGISHSVPIPRTEIADPMGSARERYLFRRAKKGDS